MGKKYSFYVLNRVKRLHDILKNVVNILKPHGEPNHSGINPRGDKLLLCKLAVSGAGGVQHAGAYIAHMYLV